MFEQTVVRSVSPAAKRRPVQIWGRPEVCLPAPKRRPKHGLTVRPNDRKPRDLSENKRRPPLVGKAVVLERVSVPTKRAPRFAATEPKRARVKNVKEACAYPNISARLGRAVEKQQAQAARAAEKARAAASPPPLQAEEPADDDPDPQPPSAQQFKEVREHKGSSRERSEMGLVLLGPRDRVCTSILAILCLVAAIGAVSLPVWIYINLCWQPPIGSTAMEVFVFLLTILLGLVIFAAAVLGSCLAIHAAVCCSRAETVPLREVIYGLLLTVGVFAVSVCVVAGFRAGRPIRYLYNDETGGYNAYANIPYWDRIVVIPDEYKGRPVTTVDSFYHDPFLQEITFGAHVETVGNAFKECKNLQSVTFRSCIQEVGSSAFQECDKLANVIFLSEQPVPFKVLIAFERKGAIPRFYVPASAYLNCLREWKLYIGYPNYGQYIVPYGLTDDMFHVEDGVLMYAYGDAREMRVPEGVHSVETQAFRYAKPVSVTLPATVRRIGERAFAANDRFRVLTLEGDTPPELGTEVFSETALDTILVPDAAVEAYRAAPGWSQYADRIFGMSALRGDFVIEGKTLTRYLGSARSVTVPDSITAIGKDAFSQNKEIVSVGLPRSLERIADSAFYDCQALRAIDLPPALREIGCNAFAYTGLENVTVPASVSQMGGGAFFGCASLLTAVVEGAPECTFSYGIDGWFSHCVSLREVSLGEGLGKLPENAFMHCKSLRSIRIPQSVIYIASYAFRGCKSLEQVELPQSLKAIGNNAFNGCTGLGSVTIPETVTGVYERAFYDCPALATVYCSGDPPIFEDDVFGAFEGVLLPIQVIVPAGSVEAYRAALAAQPNVTVEAGL